jgi:VanZ family protein
MLNKLTLFITRNAGWLLAAWIITLTILALIPISEAFTKTDIGSIDIRLDYLYHAIAFFAGTVLAILRFATDKKEEESFTLAPAKRVITVIAILILFAILHEYLQKFIPYRAFNINDIISNLAGVIAAILFLPLIKSLLVKNR